MEWPKMVGNYQLGDQIGKGAHAVVYKGLNVDTGDFVAIKMIRTSHIPQAQLPSIMMEIELMQKFRHESIVKYLECIHSHGHLCIVLEYVESGSLQTVCKKFGSFPEPLVARYITQVLRGLVYLHDQGVIHRDIKGANILATKKGFVKLADFGVATSQLEGDNGSVAGTPYWMAPEIIELSGATPKSDIWSVGCTVIELLTGAPPYYDLAPMAALFRIVQDDSPPLPDGISPLLKDFLLRCFQKDANLRISAAQLLQHRWIKFYTEKFAMQGSVNDVAVAIEESMKETIRMKENLKIRKQSVPMGSVEQLFPAEGSKRKEEVKKKKKKRKMVTKKKGKSLKDGEKKKGKKKGKNSTIHGSKKRKKGKGENGSSKSPLPDSPVRARGVTVGVVRTPTKRREGVQSAESSEWDMDSEGMGSFIMRPRALSNPDQRSNMNRILQFVESDNSGDDWGEDVLGIEGPRRQADDGGLHLHQLEVRMADDDPFAADSEASDDTDAFFLDESAEIELSITRLMNCLTVHSRTAVILDACEKLIQLFGAYPNERSRWIRHYGVVPLIEMLNVTDPVVLKSILKVVNHTMKGSTQLKENICSIGGIPLIMRFAGPDYDVEIRAEAGLFITSMCATSLLTLRMVTACGGIETLVRMLEDSLTGNTAQLLIIRQLAIEGIDAVLSGSVSFGLPRNDFCRMFVRSGLLLPLSRSLVAATKGESAASMQQAATIVGLVGTFAGQDPIVRRSAAEESTLGNILDAIEGLSNVLTVRVLRSLKMLSGSSQALDSFAKVDALGRLSTLLESKSQDVHNQLLPCLFNLCRIDPERQMRAAEVGVVPYFMDVIRTNSPQKQFALPIVCEMAHNRKMSSYLRELNGLAFLLDTLRQEIRTTWAVSVLEGIAAWVAADETVVSLLVESMSMLVDALLAAPLPSFVSLLEPLLKLAFAHSSINQALSVSAYVYELLKPDVLYYEVPRVRVNVLKLLTTFYDHHPQKEVLVKATDLGSVMSNLVQRKESIIVTGFASKLLRKVQQVNRGTRKGNRL